MISKKMEQMPFGGLYEIFGQATKLEQQGRQLIHMEIGRPDFVSPQVAVEEAIRALNTGEVHYTAVQGIDALRKAIIEKEKRRHRLDYDFEKEIVVTAGACEALSAVFFTLLNPGDEIIVPGPYFSAYYEQSVLGQFKIVELKMSIDNGWSLDLQKLEDLRTEKTRAILINSPNNPAGYILSREEISIIGDFAKKHNLMVISDECYDEFFYEGESESIATLPGMRESTIVVKSASKSYSMTGWRIGYILGPEKYLKYMNKVHQNFSTCATSFAQYGAAKAYELGDEFIDNMISVFRERRDYFYQRIKDIKGMEVIKPKGAFYIFPKITSFGMSENDFCKLLMEEADVVAVPGSFFGKSGEGHIRLAYCRTMKELETAANNMKRILENI